MKFKLYHLLFLTFVTGFSQKSFTRKDSLQGGLRAERTSFDVKKYHLDITVDPEKRFISGSNTISFKTTQNTSKIQIDLFANMRVDSILHDNKKLKYTRDNNAVFIEFPKEIKINKKCEIQFFYSGNPIVAKNAPWDGGFVFKKDAAGKPWIGVAVQGTGASLWYPVKDSQSDEPDNGAKISVAVPNGLMNVSNGNFLGSVDLKNGYTRWDWEVKNPINTYDITVNIADYTHYSEKLNDLSVDYYILKENEVKARKQFQQTIPMLECFQSKFGKYPFTEDGFKLVETPFLGMEHQSAVAYGNGYENGYLGDDLSGTGVGMLFDYILIHESGHEWFGNSITAKDIADMWIHEAFTMYSEVVYIECQFGSENAEIYINGLQKAVANDRPIIGQYGVNNEGSSDMYYKGALLLNTLKNILKDDKRWWEILLKYSETYRHKIIDTETVIDFFNAEFKMDLTSIFNQYLRYKDIPELVLQKSGDSFSYFWNTSEPNFKMPVDVRIGKDIIRLNASNEIQKSEIPIKKLNDVVVQRKKFFINVKSK
ncbi:MAG: aminopeptidase N [Flavobacterium sp.]|jgi:aminopeptidase N